MRSLLHLAALLLLLLPLVACAGDGGRPPADAPGTGDEPIATMDFEDGEKPDAASEGDEDDEDDEDGESD